MARRSSGSKGKKNKRTIKVDMTNVETVSKVPEGDYAVRVKEVTAEESQGGKPYLKFTLIITEGKHEGKTLRHTCSLQSHALFALRNTLEALNYPIPDGVASINLDELEGLEMGVGVEIEDYQGRSQSRVVDVFPVEELEDEDDIEEDDDEEYDEDEEEDLDDSEEGDEDEEDEDEDEEDEELEDYTEEELEEMSDEELIDAAKEYDVKPVYKKGKGKKKKLDREATIDAILDEIDDEDL